MQDETVVYRYWLHVAEGDDTVFVALAPGEAEGPNVARPLTVAANVSGDQRYEGDRGLHVDSLVVKGPVADPAAGLPASHRRIMIADPAPGDAGRLDAARRVVAAVRRAGLPPPAAR